MSKVTMIFFLVLAMLLPAVLSLADVAPDPLYKGMTPARKDNRVQMVSQDVVIHLDSEWCRVEADFVLHNRTQSPAVMEVGFPTGYKDEVKNLSVRRNGRKVKTKTAVEYEAVEPDIDAAVYHWTLWNMRFAAGEKVALKVSYLINPRKNQDYLITPYRQFLDQIEEEAADKQPMPPELQLLIDSMTSYSTGYIMVTGAGWYDAIADATVTIRHPNGAAAIRWLSPPENFTVSPEGIRYHFSQIKPDFDVAVEFSNTLTLTDEIALVKRAMAVVEKKQGLRKHLHYLEQMKNCLSAGVNAGEN